jgi:hypothetical protein
MAVRHAAALLLVGLWLGLLASSWISATAGFRAVDRVLGPQLRPELGTRLAGLEAGDRRLVLRHLASEINRWMFRRFGVVQLLLALAVLALAWPASGAPRWALAAALLMAALQVGLGASIESFGRRLDFLARPLPAELRRQFGLLHGAFLVADVGKAALLLAAGHLLARRSF